MVWIAVAVVLVFFLTAYRKPKLVPSRGQWMAESAYGFVPQRHRRRDHRSQGVKFAPYLTSLLSFILVMNLFGIIPGFQVAPTAHIAIPATLAIITWCPLHWVGIKGTASSGTSSS